MYQDVLEEVGNDDMIVIGPQLPACPVRKLLQVLFKNLTSFSLTPGQGSTARLSLRPSKIKALLPFIVSIIYDSMKGATCHVTFMTSRNMVA